MDLIRNKAREIAGINTEFPVVEKGENRAEYMFRGAAYGASLGPVAAGLASKLTSVPITKKNMAKAFFYGSVGGTIGGLGRGYYLYGGKDGREDTKKISAGKNEKKETIKGKKKHPWSTS